MVRGGCPVIVHYWVDLQSVHGFRCYDNIAPNAKWFVIYCCIYARYRYSRPRRYFHRTGRHVGCAKAANELSHEWKNYSVAETNQRSRYHNGNDA